MGLLNLPMSAGPADQVIGYDELGRPVRRSLLGTEYGAAYAEPAAPRSEAAPIQGRAERARASRDAFLGGLLGIGQEALRGFTAPGRAAQGEDVPLGDVWATALDYGLLGAPMEAPQGALRVGGMGDYRGVHRAPGRTPDGATASLDNLTTIYPDDIYDTRVAARYYGHMEDPAADREMIALFARMRGRPDVGVPVYRAVPKDAPDVINPGDWVTPSRKYAEGHGMSVLDGEYKIVSDNVPASSLFTDANSIFEFGYDPGPAK